MFKENFIRLCNERGEFPSVVCKQVGITPAAFSKWTDEIVPRRATLVRLADYFGVSVDDLLRIHADIRVDLQLFAADPAKEKEKEPTVTVDPKLLSLIDNMSAEELADLERYAEFIISKKVKKE